MSDPRPLTRRDWWLGTLAVALALLAHAMFPRYHWERFNLRYYVRFDNWTGRATIEPYEVTLASRPVGAESPAPPQTPSSR